MPALTNTRRWTRHEVNLPVLVFVRGIPQAIPGRGTELSAGGMALYAGIELKTSQVLELEFAAAQARVAGVVRSRQGYCFGLEFTSPLTIDADARQSASRQQTVSHLEPGPLSTGAYNLFQKIKIARGNASAYALLADVLRLAGRRDESRHAADRALRFFQHDNDVLRRNHQQRRQQLATQLQRIRELMLLVLQAYDRGSVDNGLAELLRGLPKRVTK